MTNEELKQLVREALVEVLEEAREEVDEVSTTSAVSGYNIPKAFVKKKLKAKDKKDESKMNEASYRDFRKDPRPNARKIGEAIKHVNFKLREIDTLLRHSGKLKREAQMGDSDLWKATQRQLQAMEGRLIQTAHKVRQMRT